MRLTSTFGRCAAAVAATLIATAAPASAAVPARGATTPATGPTAVGQGSRTVTLITGDRLAVATDGSNRFAVLPTPGRQPTSFVTHTVRGHLEVMPVDAVPLVRSGKLDARLFDVTLLVQYGYDDRRADLPLIVSSSAGAGAFHANAVAAGATVARDLPAVHGYAVRESRRQAAGYWASLTGGKHAMRADVGKVWLDGKRQPTLDVSVPQIGAPQAWAAGYTGAAVPVGVVDTGIDETHPDLAGKVVAAQDFTGQGNTLDGVGHGTHVASIITGSGAASGGRYKGVAPGAKLYSAKVCLAEGCDDSGIVAGMQWAAATEHVKVVNMSLGGPDTPDVDPVEQALNTLTEQYGTLFVVAAGNDGLDGSVASPSTAEDALSVGAVDKKDQLADFSSRGPRTGDNAVKPEITAPGVDIMAARGKDSTIGEPAGPDGKYMVLSGTSMATPHVAGSAAILAQQHPDWTPAQLKAGLMAAAKPNPAIGVYAQGAGRVDIGRAVHQQVTTSPTSASFGLRPWPHTDDQPISKTVTYHNPGTTAQTFSLALHTTGPDGTPTAAGLFTVTPGTVTVPAGGDATVTVTADTRAGSTDGYLGGQLTATAGDVTVQTPVAVIRDIESYDLTTTVIDRTGSPSADYETLVFGLDPWSLARPYDASGTATVRLPKGRYTLSSTLYGWDGHGYQLTLLVLPVVNLDRPQHVTLDGRAAKGFTLAVPAPDATLAWSNLQYSIPTTDGLAGTGLASYTLGGIYSAQFGPTTPVPGLLGNLSSQWGRQLPNREFTNSPYQYQLDWPRKGSFYTGYTRTVDQRELATVHKDTAAGPTGAKAENAAFAHLAGGDATGSAIAFDYDLPNQHVEYYNAEPGVQWTNMYTEHVPSTDPAQPFPVQVTETDSADTTYRPGHTYREAWNRGVFGPTLRAPEQPLQWVTRAGDVLTVAAPAYSDGADRRGYSATDTAGVTVYKDGILLGAVPRITGQFTVPLDAGTYRIVQEGRRGAPFGLSTQVTTAWTVRSAHVDAGTPQRLPLSVVRFSPNLDAQNTAPAGCLFVVPVHVEHQTGSAARRTKSLDVRVSYDDGKTWAKAAVVRLGDDGAVMLRHPAGSGYVSLQAAATDLDGNRVEQTIIHAYRY